MSVPTDTCTIVPAAIAPAPAEADEAATPAQWCARLGIDLATFHARCLPPSADSRTEADAEPLYPRASLPADFRAQLATVGTLAVWTPPRPFAEHKPTVRALALQKREMMLAWFAAIEEGRPRTEALRIAREEWHRLTGRKISERTIYRIARRIEERGGLLAPIEAYCSEKETPHNAARLKVPPDFIRALKAKVLEPGVGLWTAAVRAFAIAWQTGEAVPGLGRRTHPGEPFPYIANQLRKFAPSKAARVMAGVGKFAAKARGFLPAPPIGSRSLRLRERIVFDDKRLDISAIDDWTNEPVRLVLYIAMDEATRQILGYLLRHEGAIVQADVEALTAFVLRVCGFAGASAGYATTLIYERGTVAISTARQALLESLFPGQLFISRTGMMGGPNAPGDFAQAASGNFFGKGKLESFMATLDRYTAHIAGQRGNVYANQPAMLGDLHASAATLASPNYRLKGTMIEEAILAGQNAVAAHWLQTGEVAGGLAASVATGIRGPLLYVSEVNAAVQAAIAFYNAERGHRREGFDKLLVTTPGGSRASLTESSDDKAARLAARLAADGRTLSHLHEADAALLLHRVKIVTVRANGAVVSIEGTQRRYWHPASLAIAAAQQSNSGAKEYLALYNAEDPRELYLLRNAVSHIRPRTEVLPPDVEPHFLEALPLYDAPEANDPAALAARAASVKASTSRVQLEVARNLVPFTAAQTARREKNLEQGRELRDAISVLKSAAPARELPASAISVELASRDAIRPPDAAAYRRSLGTEEDFRSALEDEF